MFKKQSGMTWARTFYLVGIASAIVFMLPVAWFPFQLGKVAIFAFFLLLSVTSFSLSGGWKMFWRSSGAKLALAAALLPAAYLSSGFFSGTLPYSFLGAGVEADTIVFTALCFFAFIFSFSLFRTPRSAWLLLSVVFYSLVAATIFQLVSIIGGNAVVPLAAFADRSINLAGKWNDLGLIAGLLLLISIVRLEFSAMPRAVSVMLVVLAAAALLLMGFINFAFVWGLLVVVLVIVVLFKLLQSPISPDENASLNWRQHIPWLGLGTSALLIVFLFFGIFLNAQLTAYFPVSALEVRPSFSSTMEVIDAERGDSVRKFALGTGPATFGNTWLMQKPAGVNQSVFWNYDFNAGFSTVVTALGSAGVLGALAWLIAPLLIVWAFLRSLKTSLFRSRERSLALALATGSIFMALAYIFYVPSENLILLTFTFMGAAFGFLWRSAQKERDMEDVESSRIAVLLRAVFALVVIALVFGSTVMVVRRALSETYALRAQAELQAGQTEAALARTSTAAWFESTNHVGLLKIAAGFVRLQQIASDSSLPAKPRKRNFQRRSPQPSPPAGTLSPHIQTTTRRTRSLETSTLFF